MPPSAAPRATLSLLLSLAAAKAAPPAYTLRHGGQTRAFEPTAEGGDTVLYETGRQHTKPARRRVTGEVVVTLTDPALAPAIAQRCGATAWRTPEVPVNAVILTLPGNAAAVLAAAETLAVTPGVRTVEPVLARTPARRWTPNDPYFANNPANAGYQWHLLNTGARGGTAGVDIHVTGVWDTWRGAGIRIGILDDGLELTHPDISPNVDTVNDYDWNGADNDPSPGIIDTHGTTFDWHGTPCAGLAAGRGNNGIGICGVAPEATLVGMRLISPDSNDTTEAAAFLYRNDIIQVKNNSWGPDDTGNVVEGPGTLAAAALQQAVTTGRGGLGTIILWAGGNGLATGDDSNYDGYANSLYTIGVTPIADGGMQSPFGESGANLLIGAPSGGGVQDLTTTDLTGNSGYNSNSPTDYTNRDYTNIFEGSSAATPIVAGAAALLLQSKPGLGWRDVKEILIRSAFQNHPADAGWFTNAAGFHFNDKYGAGLLDVGAAVTLAANWKNLGPAASRAAVSANDQLIPDNSAAGVMKTFTFSPGENLRVEQIALKVNVSHGRRGQLNYALTSPSGTVSRLARPRPDNFPNLVDWTFTTPQFWGEPATGTWSLRVSDTVNLLAGTLHSVTLTLHGTVPDSDADGFPADVEAWFGTSDLDARAYPALTVARQDGAIAVTFPSVAGNTYTVESSPDLLTWTPASVTAAAASTTYTDTPGPARLYYRVRKP